MIWRFLFSTSVAPSFHHATVRSMSNIMICPWKNHNIVHEAPTRGHGGSRSGTRWTRIFLRPIRVIIGPITYCNPPVLPPCPDSAIHEQCCDSSIDKSQHRSWISARSLVDGGRLGTTNSSHCCKKKPLIFISASGAIIDSILHRDFVFPKTYAVQDVRTFV